jgi:hypothetical protein
LVDAFRRDLEERCPWRTGEFVIRIHPWTDGFCNYGKGFWEWEFGCSERELGDGFRDPRSVVVQVRLPVVYIIRRDRSDALRLGSHGDGWIINELLPLRYFASRLRKGFSVGDRDIDFQH